MILMSFGAIVTPSNFVICAATYASPCARTPAIVSSATRSARSLLSLRRDSSSRRAASASGDPRVRDCMLLLLSSSRASSRGTWAVGGARLWLAHRATAPPGRGGGGRGGWGAQGGVLLIEPPPPQVPRLRSA